MIGEETTDRNVWEVGGMCAVAKGESKKSSQSKSKVLSGRQGTTIRVRRETMTRVQEILEKAGISVSACCERCLEELIVRVERHEAQRCEEVQRIVREFWQKS